MAVQEVVVQVVYCASTRVMADIPEPDENGFYHLSEKQQNELANAIDVALGTWKNLADSIPSVDLDWVSTNVDTVDGHQIEEWD